MPRVRRALLSASIALLAATAALAPAPVRAEDVVHPWEQLDRGFLDSYAWPSLLWHASAVAITPPLAWRIDGPVQRWFQREDPLGNDLGRITLVAGYFVPIVVPLGLYLGGLGAEHAELATAGAAAAQAVFVQGVVISTLKWLTDRAGPYHDGKPDRDRSGFGLLHNTNDPHDFDFNPFALNGALRWPSGHAASHVALVSSLVAFYPQEPWLAVVGYAAVLTVSAGMIEGDAHWLSDVLAGLLMGHAIGWQIGTQFRERFELRNGGAPGVRAAAQPSLLWLPALSQRSAGFQLLGAW
jgi:membrane-associated phospholipid phosphatase